MSIDLIIKGHHLFTGCSDQLISGALAISGERIVAVGSVEEIHHLVTTSSSKHKTSQAPAVYDAQDALVIPGFHDAHLHFFHSALYASPLATTFLGKNEADCVERLKKFAEQRPCGWLLAQGWREYRWDPPVMPSKHSLDAAFPERPVALYSGDAHTLWLNSVALRELGLHRESVPPQGGSYDRDVQGNLSGIVRESAAMEVMPQIMDGFTTTELAHAYAGFFAQLAQNGVTSVCDMSLMANPGLDFIRDDIHELLLKRDELSARVHLFPTLLEDMTRFEAMRERYTTSLLQASGFKQFFDGVSSQHTAWLSEPYTNARTPTDCGKPIVDPAVMKRSVLAATKKGYPVRIHAIGDAAIHAALNIFEEAQAVYGSLPPHTHHCLEHLENFLPGDPERLAALGVVASVQPPHMTLDPGGPERDLGDQRCKLMWPFRTLLDAGAILALGTDSPVVAQSPLNVCYSALTRQDPTTHQPHGGWMPKQRISMAETLRAYSSGSAAAAGRAHELGCLRPGMLADIAVLDRNVLTCAPDDIQKTKVQATFVGGRCVFKR